MSPIEQSLASIPDYRLPYCAGYFDGEGCIWVGLMEGSRHYLRISVMTADYDTLLMFKDLFGGVVRAVRASSPRKNIFRWSMNSAEAVKTLSKLLPFMTAKREEAQLVIDSGWQPLGRGVRLSDEQLAKRAALRNALKGAKKKNLKTSNCAPDPSPPSQDV